MRKRQNSFGLVTAVLVICAFTMTAITIRHEFFMGSPASAAMPPTVVGAWDDVSRGGHVLGDNDNAAPVTILEFADFQCPYCRTFALGALRAIRSEFGKDVRVVFRHWPLPYHHLAYAAARAAECAADQGRFEAYHDALFQHQDSLGIIDFGALAQLAGVKDTHAFGMCMSSPARVGAIEDDIAAAKLTGGTGTPTIVISGRLLHELPDTARLRVLVNQALARSRQKHVSDEGRAR